MKTIEEYMADAMQVLTARFGPQQSVTTQDVTLTITQLILLDVMKEVHELAGKRRLAPVKKVSDG